MKLTSLALCLTTLALALHAQAPAAQARLLCLYFDLDSMNVTEQSSALDSAVKFIQEQTISSDRISVMTYASSLNVLQDFTTDHDSILAALRTITPADAPKSADQKLGDLQSAIKLLAALPEKKTLVYFSSGIRNGVDNQAQLRATTNAAVTANVAIYPIDSRGLIAVPR